MFFSPLEQFLLLQDKYSFTTLLMLGIPLEFNDIQFRFVSSFQVVFDFILYEIINIQFVHFNIYFTLINLQYYKLSLFLIILLTGLASYNSKVFPSSLWQYFTQQSHILAQVVLKPTFGAHYPFEVRFYNFYPMLYFIFIFILCNNLLGLVPYGFSNSAFIVHNFTLSFLFLAGLTLIGIFIQGIYYYQLFIPKNLPTYLIPFLMIIEIISHVAKVFSLAIRLFANIMSSHILLHILAGFTLKILDFKLVIGLIPCIIILIIVFLEIGIAFLQAYVFTVLLAIYFEETFKLLELKSDIHKSEHRPLILESDF